MVKLIAETAWHHDGDYSFMESLVNELIDYSKADIIKLHISLDFEEYFFKDHASYESISSKAFTKEQWTSLIEKIKKSNKELMLLFNDKEAIEFGMQFNPSLIEIHSVCLNDYHLLARLKNYNSLNIPIVLGIGGSSLYEVENTISFLNYPKIILMHGFQNYPTKYEEINFNKISKIMKLYPSHNHGYADHTAWDEPNNELITLFGAAMGMDFIEKHVTSLEGIERTDWQAAINIERFNAIADRLKILDTCKGDGLLYLNKGEKAYSIFGPNKKAAFLNNKLVKGEKLTWNHLQFKRTSQLSNTSQIEIWDLIGKTAIDDLHKNTLIEKEYFK